MLNCVKLLQWNVFYLLQTVCIQTHLYILQLQAVSSRYHLLELHNDKINLIVEIIVYNG